MLKLGLLKKESSIFVWMVILFTIPISVMFYITYQFKMDVVDFARKEIEGIYWLQKVSDIENAFIAEKQSMDVRFLSQRLSDFSYEYKKSEIYKSRAINDVDLKLLDGQLVINTLRKDKENKTFDAFEITLQMQKYIVDKSNLILDPDLDSYYLMATVTDILPSFKLKYLQKSDPLVLKEIQKNLNDSLSKSILYDDQFYGASSSLEKNLKPHVAFEMISDGDLGIALTRLEKFRSIGLIELKILLEKRIQSHLNDLWSSLGVVLFFYVLALAVVFILLQKFILAQKKIKLVIKKNQAEKQYVQGILNTSLDGIIGFDKMGTIIEFNPACENILLRPKSAAFGKNISEVVISLDLQSRLQVLNSEHKITDHKAILGKKFETSIENFVGEQICVEMVILKHQQEHGNQFVLFMRDLTENKKLEDAATNSARLASLGVMASGIAHEINNPVAIIYGMAGLLGRGLNGEDIGQDKMRDMTTKIRTACNRILSIIRGIKAFAHNGDNDKFETISLAALIDESLEYMNEKFRSAAIQLKVDPVPEVSIECRRVQISQIIINLLGNAFDAVREQKPNWVHLDFQLMPDVLIIQVTDSGGGIPPEVEKKLFTPFFTTKGVGKGTGLGLSISMGILADHQGSLSLDRLCKNTRFVIKLPLRQSASLSDSEKKAA